jgi:hypothetical protein
MKLLYFAIALLTLFSVPSTAQLRQQYELQPNLKSPKEKKVLAFLHTDTVQYTHQGGLTFSIRLKNTSADSLTVINPIDLLSMKLMDTALKNVLIPFDTRAFSGYNAPIPFESFSVEEIFINGEQTKIDISNTRTVIIPANSNLEMFFKISDVMPSGATLPFKSKDKIKILPGTYTLIMHINVMESESKNRVLYSLKRMIITYKLCN